jgi:hypothetical protein
MKKKQQILGALNFIVLSLAYDYPFARYFEKTNPNQFHFGYLWDAFKKEHWDTLKVHPTDRFDDFNYINDFGGMKVNALIFLIITARGADKRFFLDFFTDFEAGFYFKPSSHAIVNPGIATLLRDRKDSFFTIGATRTQITEHFSSKEDIRARILNSFFEDKMEGEAILEKLQKNLDAINSRFSTFPSMTDNVCEMHTRNNFAFRVYNPLEQAKEFSKEMFKNFYDMLVLENFNYQVGGSEILAKS